MKACPNCGRESLRNVTGTNHMSCPACNSMVVHEGNGYVLEIL